jgi:hypothetical protein
MLGAEMEDIFVGMMRYLNIVIQLKVDVYNAFVKDRKNVIIHLAFFTEKIPLLSRYHQQ